MPAAPDATAAEARQGCTRFEWLREHGQEVRELLKECRGLRRGEYIEKMRSSY